MIRIRAHIVLTLFWAIILLLNIFLSESVLIGIFASAMYALSMAVIIKRIVFTHATPFVGLTLGACGVLAMFIILSTLMYWFIGWEKSHILFVLFLMPLLTIFFPHSPIHTQEDNAPIQVIHSSSNTWLRAFIIFFLECTLFIILFSSRVTHAILSPWETVPTYFFPLFFFTSWLLVVHCVQNHAKHKIFLVALHGILMFSVAFIIYPLGFGFDPFIHRATLDYIYSHGVIEPKTPYYIGQYTFFTAIGHLTSPTVMHVFYGLFTPILTSLFLFASLKNWGQPPFFLAALMIPFGSFILTTPQSMANIFFIILIIGAFSHVHHNKVPLMFLAILALATACIHPLTGIPSLMFITLLYTYRISHHERVRNFFIILITIFGSILLPISFLAYSSTPFTTHIQNSISSLSFPQLPWEIIFERPMDPILDILYGFRFALLPLIIASFTYLFLLIKRHASLRHILIPYACLLFILLVNATLLANGVNIPLVIDYEQHNYAIRVMELFLIALIPLWGMMGKHCVEQLMRERWLVRSIGYAVFAVFITGSLYFSYPRNNPIERSHGYNVSLADIHTVQAIEKHANGKSYAVLANQSVSASAIQQLGFQRYIQTRDSSQFIYPIPTGSAWYTFFLNMIYTEPDKTLAQNAMEYMGVDVLYFVINPYWWDADTVAEKALTYADESFIVEQSNRVFVYRKNSPQSLQ